MKKTFMWYYTLILLILAVSGCFLEWINYGGDDAFWAIILYTPSIFWLFNKSK